MKNDYYVYVHKIKATGEIFYVGKGSGRRAYKKDNRNSKWEHISKTNQWYVEIYASGLTENEAFDLESKLISDLNPVANIAKRSTKPRPIDWKLFHNYVYYDPDSKTGLKARVCFAKNNIDDELGYLDRSGYYSFSFEGKEYKVHRVVWAIVNNQNITDGVIDHIDRIRTNNNIANLRKVTQRDNAKNASIRGSNVTGIVGVSPILEGYQASITFSDGTYHYKKFPRNKFGDELALALAKEYRHRMATEDNGYIPNNEYKRDGCLTDYSEQEIEAMLNCNKYSNNTSGQTGIHFQEYNGKTNVVARYHSNSRRISKQFSIKKFGLLPAFKMAVEWRRLQEEKYIKNNPEKVIC